MACDTCLWCGLYRQENSKMKRKLHPIGVSDVSAQPTHPRSSYLFSYSLSQRLLQFGDEFPDLIDRDQVEKDRQDVLPVVDGNHVLVFESPRSVTQDRNGFPALLGDVLPRPVLVFHRGIKLLDGHVGQAEPAAPFFTDHVMNGLLHPAADGFRDTHAHGAGHPIQAQDQQFFGHGLRLLGGQGQSVFFEEIRGDGRRDELNESFRGLLGLFGHGVLGTTGPLIASLSHWERVARSAG